MDIRKKHFELQAQIRQNADELRQSLGGLSNWQEDIKSKEEKLIRERVPQMKEEEDLYAKVRSHVFAETKSSEPEESQTSSSTANGNLSPLAEKIEAPLDENEEKRHRANIIKDLGNKYVKMGEYQLAIEEYTRAIEVYPEDAVFFTNRALCHLKLEKYNECIEDCDAAIDIDKLAVKAYYRRMQANESLGNNMDALKDCTSALMIDPKNGEALRSLDRINERIRKIVRKPVGPNFTEMRDNMMNILPHDKPVYKRSTKTLRRVPVNEVVLPKAESGNTKISDEDIDRLFNSNCGPFVEVKPNVESKKTQHDKKEIKDVKIDKEELKRISKRQEQAAALQQLINEVEEKSVPQTSPSEGQKPTDVSTPTTTEEIIENTKSLPPIPATSVEFYIHWKELLMAQKYNYLKLIPVQKLQMILGAAFDSQTFSDVLKVLHEYYLPAEEPSTAHTLLEVSKHTESGILSMMMTSEDRRAIQDIVAALQDRHPSIVESIKKNFNLS